MYILNFIKIKLICNVKHVKFLDSSSKSSLSPDPVVKLRPFCFSLVLFLISTA